MVENSWEIGQCAIDDDGDKKGKKSKGEGRREEKVTASQRDSKVENEEEQVEIDDVEPLCPCKSAGSRVP